MRFIGGFWPPRSLAAALVARRQRRDRERAGRRGPVFNVGYWQDLDSPNVTVGVLVADYELWNLQYADPHRQGGGRLPETIPGLAESWEAKRRRADVHVHTA